MRKEMSNRYPYFRGKIMLENYYVLHNMLRCYYCDWYWVMICLSLRSILVTDKYIYYGHVLLGGLVTMWLTILFECFIERSIYSMIVARNHAFIMHVLGSSKVMHITSLYFEYLSSNYFPCTGYFFQSIFCQGFVLVWVLRACHYLIKFCCKVL